MRIEPSGPQPLGFRAPTPAVKPADTASESAPPAASFALTSMLANLLAKARQEPDVRPEAVQAAAERLASGELDSPALREETAELILDALSTE